MEAQTKPPAESWDFLTSHGYILLCLQNDPDLRIRDLATRIGITERRAQSIVSELADAGYVKKERIGRRNRYCVRMDLPLRHPRWGKLSVGEFLSFDGGLD